MKTEFEAQKKRMKKYSIMLLIFAGILFATLLSGRAAQADTHESDQANRHILMVTVRAKDSSGGMFLNMVYTEAFKRLGRTFEYQQYPPIRCIVLSDAGEVDGEITRADRYGESHPNVIRVEEPHYTSGFLALSMDESLSLNGWESLGNTKYLVNYRRGVKGAEPHILNVVKPENIEIVNTIPSGLRKLITGRCDVYVESESELIPFLTSDAFRHSGIRIAGVMQQYTAHAFLHKKNRELVPQLTKVLKAMKAEGLFEQYRERSGFGTLFEEDGSVKQITEQHD